MFANVTNATTHDTSFMLAGIAGFDTDDSDTYFRVANHSRSRSEIPSHSKRWIIKGRPTQKSLSVHLADDDVVGRPYFGTMTDNTVDLPVRTSSDSLYPSALVFGTAAVINEKYLKPPAPFWDAWKDYLPTLERDYAIRYQQHFASYEQRRPVSVEGRKYYEQPWITDGGRKLYERYADGDVAIAALLKFGWKVIRGTDGLERIFPPATFREYYAGFYRGVYIQLGDALESYDDILVPSIAFIKRGGTDLCFVRPGLDPVPDPQEWQVISTFDDGGIDLPLMLYAQLVAERRPPLNPLMFDHDNSHLADCLARPEVHDAVVAFFARMTMLEGALLSVATESHRCKEYGPYIRSNCFNEELVVPNIARRAFMRRMVPHLFISKGAHSVETNVAAMEPLSNFDLAVRASNLASRLGRVISRHGGGMNDPYNSYLDLNVRTTPEGRVATYLNHWGQNFPFHFVLSGREQFSQFAIESLLGMASDIAAMAVLIDKPEALDAWLLLRVEETVPLDELRVRFRTLMVDRISRIEIALWAAIKYQISGAGVIRDSTEQVLSRNSATYRYFSSFAIPGSFTYMAFVSDEFTGP